MDVEKFQEKMDPNHRAYFCRMLKMKELPDYLLEQYVQVKLMTDRIDGFLSPGDLALIAIIAGFDPETGKFCVTEQPAEQLQAQPLDEAVDKVVEETLEPPIEQPVEQPAGYKPSEDSSEVKDFDLAEAKGENQQSDQKQSAAPPDDGKAMPWSPGMPVNVLQGDELNKGKIVGVHPPAGSRKAVQLTVEFDGGEIVTVEENEVEAI